MKNLSKEDAFAVRIGATFLVLVTFLGVGLFGSQKYYYWRIASEDARNTQIAIKTSPKDTQSQITQIPAITPTAPQTPPKQSYIPPKTPAPVVVPSPKSNVDGLTPVSQPAVGSTGNTTPPVSQVVYSSLNWSGYLSANGKYTGVSGSWLVPTVTGNGSSNSSDAAWIGIGGVTTSDLIQIGTYDNVSANGQASYAAFYETLPNVAQPIPGFTVSPGNSVSASVLEVSPGVWTVSITNNTVPQTFTKNISYASSYSSAEWIEEEPSYSNGRLVPLDHFGSVNFVNCLATLNDTSLNLTGAQAQMVILVNQAGQRIAVPTAIGTEGSGFTVNQS